MIYTYTSDEAVDDGILNDLDQILPEYFRRGWVKYITIGVATLHYIEDGKVNAANMIDLLIQADQIRKQAFDREDWFFSSTIETPAGEKQEIFIAQNETGRYTIMLPSEY